MIAQYPPMGRNSWDCYGAAVTEATVRANADYMAKHLRRFGWEYVVVDIQWYQPTAVNHACEPFASLEMDGCGRESHCAHPLYRTDDACAWLAPRRDGSGAYVALFNLSDEPRTVSLPDGALEFPAHTATDLWTNAPVDPLRLTATLALHDAAVYHIR